MAKINNIDDFLAQTNFEDLKQQKKALLATISSEEGTDIAEKLDGLLCFIDAFQDMCVDVYGIDERTVFDLSDEGDGNAQLRKLDKLESEEESTQEEISSTVSISDTIEWYKTLTEQEQNDVRETMNYKSGEEPVWYDVKLMYIDDIIEYIK